MFMSDFDMGVSEAAPGKKIDATWPAWTIAVKEILVELCSDKITEFINVVCHLR